MPITEGLAEGRRRTKLPLEEKLAEFKISLSIKKYMREI